MILLLQKTAMNVVLVVIAFLSFFGLVPLVAMFHTNSHAGIRRKKG